MMVAGDIGPARLKSLLAQFSDADGIFEAGRRACASVVGEELSRRLFSDSLQQQAEDVAEWLKSTPAAGIVSWMDEDFPREMMAFAGAPSLFLLRGRRELLLARRIAVAGAVRPDGEGLENAANFSSALVRAGRSVVTFLENETDAAVTRAALASENDGANGLIVLSATGPDRLYPSGMRELYHRAADRGLVMTPLTPGTAVSEHTLAQRLVVCAYLCPELLVVQSEFAGKTQALARLFAENNRDVFVIPGSIHCALYKGSHRLLREGARLTETVADITQFGSETT